MAACIVVSIGSATEPNEVCEGTDSETAENGTEKEKITTAQSQLQLLYYIGVIFDEHLGLRRKCILMLITMVADGEPFICRCYYFV